MSADRGARLEDLPEVLDTEQLCAVLRVSARKLYELVKDGRLHRLAYSRYLYVAKPEVRRFLREETRFVADDPTDAGDGDAKVAA